MPQFRQDGRSYAGEVIDLDPTLEASYVDSVVRLRAVVPPPIAAPGGGATPGIFPISDYAAALDSSTDDTAAWQAAFAAAAGAGGEVQWLGEGTSLAKDLRIPGGVTLHLGPNATLRLHPSAVSGEHLIRNADFVGGNTNITIRGGRFDGGERPALVAGTWEPTVFTLGDNITTMQFQNVTGLRLEGCFVTGGIAEGVYLGACSDFCLVGVTTEGNGVPTLDGSGLHIDGCTGGRVVGHRSAGNGFDGALVQYSEDVAVDVGADDNYRDGVRGNHWLSGRLTVAARGNLRGCYLNEANASVHVTGSATSNSLHGFLCNTSTDCSFSGNAVGNGPAGAGYDVWFLDGSERCTFDGHAVTVLDEGTDNRIGSGFSGDAATLAGEAAAYYLARGNHTGTQAAGTITGLAAVATSGSAADLFGTLDDLRLSTNIPRLNTTAVHTAALEVHRATNVNAFGVRIAGDLQHRAVIRGDGRISLGDGATNPNVHLTNPTSGVMGLTGGLVATTGIGAGMAITSALLAPLHGVKSGAGVQDAIAVGNYQTAAAGVGPGLLFVAGTSGLAQAARIAAIYVSGGRYDLSVQVQAAAGAGPVERARWTGSGQLLVGTQVSAGAAAGELVLANLKGLRGVDTAGGTTLPLLQLDAADLLRLGVARTAAAVPGAFSATHYIRVRDSAGLEVYLPCAAVGW
jgi:hypothetical protein